MAKNPASHPRAVEAAEQLGPLSRKLFGFETDPLPSNLPILDHCLPHAIKYALIGPGRVRKDLLVTLSPHGPDKCTLEQGPNKLEFLELHRERIGKDEFLHLKGWPWF
jgi:hypothetical protein